jgi:hypothetical protein
MPQWVQPEIVTGLTTTVAQTAGTYSTYKVEGGREGERERERERELLFPPVGDKLRSFPPFECNDFMKCHRIMNNPVHVKHFVVTENITFRIQITNRNTIFFLFFIVAPCMLLQLLFVPSHALIHFKTSTHVNI